MVVDYISIWVGSGGNYHLYHLSLSPPPPSQPLKMVEFVAFVDKSKTESDSVSVMPHPLYYLFCDATPTLFCNFSPLFVMPHPLVVFIGFVPSVCQHWTIN